MKPYPTAFCAFIVAIVVGAYDNVSAAIVIDQSFSPATIDNITAIYDIEDLAQTFTAGISGQLMGVDLALNEFSNPNQPLIVEIRTTALGLPAEAGSSANLLGDAMIAPGVLPPGAPAPFPDPFVFVDLSSQDIHVNAGDILAIVLRSSTSPGQYFWDGTIADGYSGGVAFFRISGGAWIAGPPDSVAEHPFRTYIAAAVPEPHALAMWAGLAAMARAAALFASRRTKTWS